jgi:hypothetical protein
MSRPIKPLPEIISGDRFDVRRSENENVAYIDLENRELVVPFSDSPHAEFIRAHESGHLAFTPLGGKFSVREDIPNRVLQAIEDCRINSALRASGIETGAEPTTPQPWNPPENPLEAAVRVIGFNGRHEEAESRRDAAAYGPKVLEAADEVIRRFSEYEKSGKVAPFEETLKASEFLTDALSAEEPPGGGGDGEPGDGEGKPGEGDSAGDKDADLKGVEGNTASNKPTEKAAGDTSISKPFLSDDSDDYELPSITEEEGEAAKEAGIVLFPGKSKPGKMQINRPRLTIPLRRKKNLGKKTDETGSIPVAFHRYSIDGRIFRAQKLDKEGIAVLIDTSGSMKLGAANVEWILSEAPASIIAIYSAQGHTGTLTVISNGKRMLSADELAAAMRRAGGMNVVDVPALEWLAARKERRKIWLCDGLITGEGDRPLMPRFIRQATEIIRSAKIVRVDNMKDLKAHKSQLLGRGEITYKAPVKESRY